MNWIDPRGWDKQKENQWWKWGAENWLWQYLYGGGEWVDPKFLLIQAEEFQKNRLPLTEWFSLAEIPWGPPAAYGSEKVGTWLENFFARRATRDVLSFRITRNSIYMSGYRPGWFRVSGVTRFISRGLTIATVVATASDIGTMVYSYYQAHRRYYGY